MSYEQIPKTFDFLRKKCNLPIFSARFWNFVKIIVSSTGIYENYVLCFLWNAPKVTSIFFFNFLFHNFDSGINNSLAVGN